MSTITTERLSALNAAYARCVNNDQLEDWPNFFQEKCLYLITTADNHDAGMQAGLVYADTRGMLKDRIVAMREANVYEEHRYRHLIGTPFLVEQNRQNVCAETPFIVMRIMRGGDTAVFATGRYLDRVVVTEDGVLQLAERVVVCDSTNIDTLLVIPL